LRIFETSCCKSKEAQDKEIDFIKSAKRKDGRDVTWFESLPEKLDLISTRCLGSRGHESAAYHESERGIERLITS